MAITKFTPPHSSNDDVHSFHKPNVKLGWTDKRLRSMRRLHEETTYSLFDGELRGRGFSQNKRSLGDDFTLHSG